MSRSRNTLREHLPIATLVIFVINVACYIWEYTQGDPSLATNPVTLRFCMYQGALAEGDWYVLFTHTFFHYGIWHIASNMFCLWIYGINLEMRIGSLRYAVIYLISIIGSGLLINFTGGVQETANYIIPYVHAGASGPIWGLMCAMFVYCIRNKLDITYSIRGIIVNLVYSFSAGVSWQGHIGGGIAGLIASLALCM